MDVVETVRDSQILLEKMSEKPEAVLEALQPAERTEVVDELRRLSEWASRVQAEAELVEVANAVHRLVAKTPALAALLQPRETGATKVQKRRKTRKITREVHAESHYITPEDHKEHTSEDLHAQKHAARIRNHVVACREQLEQALQSFAEAKGEGGR